MACDSDEGVLEEYYSEEVEGILAVSPDQVEKVSMTFLSISSSQIGENFMEGSCDQTQNDKVADYEQPNLKRRKLKFLHTFHAPQKYLLAVHYALPFPYRLMFL